MPGAPRDHCTALPAQMLCLVMLWAPSLSVRPQVCIFRDSHSASESGPCHKVSGTTVSAVPSSLIRLSMLKVTSSLSILQGSQGTRGPQGITGPKGTTVSAQSPGPGPGQFASLHGEEAGGLDWTLWWATAL